MVSFAKLGSEIMRDYATAGVPGSGPHTPSKAEFRAWMATVEGAAHDPTTGLHTIGFSAKGMTSRTTNGAGDYSAETTTNKVMVEGKAFDPDTAEYVQGWLPMPKSWDGGPVKVRFYWMATSGSGNVVWAFQALCLGDDEVLDTAFGAAVEVTDGLANANRKLISAISGDCTPAGSPAGDEGFFFQIYRNAGDAGDTLGEDAVLIGVEVLYTTAAETDD